MRGFTAILLVVLVHACGRIGFEVAARDDDGGAGDGRVVDDAPVVDDASEPDDAPGACGWQPCATGFQACCVGSAGMCAAAGTCTGAVYACSNNTQGGRCPPTSRCCFPPTGGSQCLNVNTVCGVPD